MLERAWSVVAGLCIALGLLGGLLFGVLVVVLLAKVIKRELGL